MDLNSFFKSSFKSRYFPLIPLFLVVFSLFFGFRFLFKDYFLNSEILILNYLNQSFAELKSLKIDFKLKQYLLDKSIKNRDQQTYYTLEEYLSKINQFTENLSSEEKAIVEKIRKELIKIRLGLKQIYSNSLGWFFLAVTGIISICLFMSYSKNSHRRVIKKETRDLLKI